jgi:hypothetical protein
VGANVQGRADPQAPLNKTNLSLLAKHLGKRTGPWIGQAVEVYWDETVSFGGEMRGGIRLRFPKDAGRAVPPLAPAEDRSPIPF